VSWSSWDLSVLAVTHFGSEAPELRRWATPCLEAFCAGAWMIQWTEEALFWIAKPEVHIERRPDGSRRMHREDGAALTSDLEPLFFWKGVLVPDFVILQPGTITVRHIEQAENSEIRRVMIERFGPARYVRESGALVVDECAADHPLAGLRTARLLRKPVPGDEDIVYLDCLNSTPEPDGTTKRYMLRINPELYGGRAGRECLAASASTWRRKGDLTQLIFATPEDYHPVAES
jgi:hypothetical protein